MIKSQLLATSDRGTLSQLPPLAPNQLLTVVWQVHLTGFLELDDEDDTEDMDGHTVNSVSSHLQL